jgi:CHAT domain-containing protein
LENYDEALRLYQRSLAITEKTYGPNHPEVASTLCNIADTYCDKGDYTAALRPAERSLKIREKALGPNHPDFADSLCSLADIYRGLGDNAQALAMAKRSLAIMQKHLRPDHPLMAQCLFVLAEVQKNRSALDEALALHQRALAINEKISGPDHPDVFRGLASVAQIQAMKGDFRRSVSTLSDLSTRQRRYLAHHFQTSSWMVASRVADMLRSSSEMLQTLCAVGTQNATGTYAAEAAGNSALNKALWEEVQAARAAFEANHQIKAEELYSQYQSLQAQLTRLPQSEADQAKRDAKRLELESKLNQVVAELGQRVGFVAQGVLEQTPTLSGIARQLPAGSVLLDFVQYRRCDLAANTNQWKEQRYTAYLTFPAPGDSANVVVERTDLGEASPIEELIATVSKRMSAGQYEAKDLSAALMRLSDLVYAPLAEHLTNVSHLIICPDGQLSRLPFEMLQVGNKFLVEEKTISYVTSGREVVRLANTKPSVRTSAPLVMGNPDFDLDLSKTNVVGPLALKSKIESQKSEIDQSLLTSAPTKMLSRDCRGLKFTPLLGAEAEARSVAELLSDDCVLRLGAEARESELKAVRSPRMLHLATHGFFLSDQEFKQTNSIAWDSGFAGLGPPKGRTPNDWENPLVRCGIALAGANHALQITNAIAEDGLLTGLEASLLNLQGTELVILSACDSGTGEIKIGEGVMSLRRAFRIAGAETVLASHWKVSDKATTKLMTEFIRRWRAGQPRAEAWRAAQLELLPSKGAADDFSNPYFWAAFTLTGQWR